MNKVLIILLMYILPVAIYAQTANDYRAKANNGDAYAQFSLGWCYANGKGVSQDYSQAVYWYKKSAEQGNAGAQSNLGWCYEKGKGVSQDYSQAVYWYKKSAEQGNAGAQCFLGICYANGKGVSQDYSQAVYWYKKAAEQGIAIAQRSLYWCYHKGEGVSQNDSQAVYWLKKAAEQGNADAQSILGSCYGNGEGVSQDYSQAVYWFKKSAEQGNAGAQCFLGICYANGKGVSQDYSQAVYWYKKSAEQGDADAQRRLYWCYRFGNGASQDDSQAVYWLKKAAEQGDADAQFNLGALSEYGSIVSQDYSQAVYWYRKSAEQDYVPSLDKLAYLYAKGFGVSQDLKEAYRLVDKAISLSKEDRRPLYLNSKGEIALIAGDKKLALSIWKEFQNRYPDKIKVYSAREDKVFVKTMLKGLDDIDNMIPVTNAESANTFAFIIGNEQYKYVPAVPFAKNDGTVFAEYCKKTLGIPESNVKIWTDATLGEMKLVISKIKQVSEAFDGDANIILYYAGHGIPSDDQKNSYLLPTDGAGAGESGLSLNELYGTLGKLNTKSIFVILDACFSGAQRNGEMFASTRGVAIKPKQEAPEGNLIVLSAAQGDETAMPYNDKEHGLFSYFLLKKLQESKGDCTIGELADYVTTNVKRTSISISDKIQTPMVSASSTISDWRNIKLK